MAYSDSITSSSSNSSSSQSNGILEIDLDRLPCYKRNRTASPVPSVGSSPCLPIGFCSHIVSTPPRSSSSNIEYSRFSKMIGNLGKILNDNEWDFSDAEIIVDGRSVGVNRLVLASASSFFFEFFRKQKSSSEYRPRFYMTDLVPNGKVGYEAFVLLLGYLYTGNLKSYPEEVSKCIDDGCPHDACHPAIDFQLQLLYACAIFQIDELVSSLQTDLLNTIEKALVDDVIPILLTAFCCKLDLLQDRCIKRVAQSDIHNLWIEKELPYELQLKVRLFRVESKKETGAIAALEYPDENGVKQIYQALDRNDVHSLCLLLKESVTTLDDVYGLHYAVSYCEPNVISRILELGIANINLRNSRGYTALHMAARRMHPMILASLLSYGACASDCTFDGHSPVTICRRITNLRDCEAKEYSGDPIGRYRFCVQILVSGRLRNLTSISSWIADADSELTLGFTVNRAVRDSSFSGAFTVVPPSCIAESQSQSQGTAKLQKHCIVKIIQLMRPQRSHGHGYWNEPLMKLRKHLTTVRTLVRTIQMMRPHRLETMPKNTIHFMHPQDRMPPVREVPIEDHPKFAISRRGQGEIISVTW